MRAFCRVIAGRDRRVVRWWVRGGTGVVIALVVPCSAVAAPWNEDKAFFSENAGASSSKVDAGDLNGDGTIDLVFANGEGFDKGDVSSTLVQQTFLNDGTTMTPAPTILGSEEYNGRAVKIRDIDYDGDNDIVLGTAWTTQSQLFINDGDGNFTNSTDPNLPEGNASVGDLELGDVDGDGDLDIALANWGNPGPGLSVAQSDGGITLLWTQMGKPSEFGGEGTAMFEDVTLKQMPDTKVRWSWELEFIDVDNDYDLDIVVSANVGDLASLFLFVNDGSGHFIDATAESIPQGKFAQDVEPMDINGDGTVDLLTVHDGASGRNRLLLNDKNGKFSDGSTDLLWPKLDNPSSYDFMAAFYDYDSNGKVDWILGAIQTAQDKYPDRLIYESAGKYKSNKAAFIETPVSTGTYAIVLADFNKDFRLDMAMAQKENATQKKLFLASDEVPVDTAPPLLTNIEAFGDLEYPGNVVLRLRSHDNKSPLMLHDYLQANNNEGFPFIESWTFEPKIPDDEPGMFSEPGQWYGEYLWRINFEVPDAAAVWYRVCAIDAASNKRCTDIMNTTVTGGTATESDSEGASSTTGGSSASSTGDTGITSTGGAGTTDAPVTTGELVGSDGDSMTGMGPVPTGAFVSSSGSGGAASETGAGQNDGDDGTLGDGCGCKSGGGASLLWLGVCLLGVRRGRRTSRFSMVP